MGVVRTGESEYDKELAKWNTPKRDGGYGPDGYEHFPLMLSKAQKQLNGQYAVHQMPPSRYSFLPGPQGDGEWTQAIVMAEEFTRRCQRTVRNQQEYDRALTDGWVYGQDKALEAAQGFEKDIADAAAMRAWSDRNMGDVARREAAAADAATSEHLPELPVKRGRGRPKKDLVPA